MDYMQLVLEWLSKGILNKLTSSFLLYLLVEEGENNAGVSF